MLSYRVVTVSLCLTLYVKYADLDDFDEHLSQNVDSTKIPVPKFEQVPYQVSFKEYLGEDKINSVNVFDNFCMGSLVAPDIILTAAHCFTAKQSFLEKLFKIHLNVRSLQGLKAVSGWTFNLVRQENPMVNTTNIQFRNLKKCQFPPTYEFPNDDIAIVYTDSPFELDNYTQIIGVSPFNIDFSMLPCWLLTYGTLDPDDDEFISELMLVRTVAMSNADCSVIHQKNMSRFLCPGILPGIIYDVGAVAGGPIVCQHSIDPEFLDYKFPGQLLIVGVGILMANEEFEDLGSGPLYTRVAPYIEFFAGSRACRIEASVWIFIAMKFVIYAH